MLEAESRAESLVKEVEELKRALEADQAGMAARQELMQARQRAEAEVLADAESAREAATLAHRKAQAELEALRSHVLEMEDTKDGHVRISRAASNHATPQCIHSLSITLRILRRR